MHMIISSRPLRSINISEVETPDTTADVPIPSSAPRKTPPSDARIECKSRHLQYAKFQKRKDSLD